MEKAVAPDSCFERLIDLVQTLRSDRGCPWDQAQTPEKIKVYLMEEAYEVLDAIESGTHEEVCAELGDLLFHIVFLAVIFEEIGAFSIKDVVRAITEKMIRRHPHVFGKVRVSNVAEVKAQWQEIKSAEAQDKEIARKSFLDTVPRKLPALMRAYRLGERASGAGFDWPDVGSVLMKVDEELREFKAVLKKGDAQKSAEEFGDLLFTMVNLSRFIRVHPETALTAAISKFISRFQSVEEALRKQGRSLDSASIEEMDRIWEECKADEGTESPPPEVNT